MIKIEGKYGTAKVYTDVLGDAAADQIKNLMDDDYSIGSVVRIMPDVHAGADNVIGLTMTVRDKISPLLIGSDIGCGVSYQEFTTNKPISLELLDKLIRKNIPSGAEHRSLENRNVIHDIGVEDLVSKMRLKNLNNLALKGIATLGGGNHFIEVYRSRTGTYGLAVHTGSRSLGGAVFKHYRSKMIDEEKAAQRTLRNKTVWKFKKEGREKELQAELARISAEYNASRGQGRNIRYLAGQDKEDYLYDMGITQEYALLNRLHITNIILKALTLEGYEIERTKYVDKPHNYVDLNRGILRKGAQSAEEGETVLIPINMKDGMIIGTANGNRDWNYSAPHGAGRVLSRTEAKKQLSIVDFRNEMQGIYSSVVGRDTLDEAPKAYKPIEEIAANIKDVVTVNKIMKPIYNFKGGSENGKPIERS